MPATRCSRGSSQAARAERSAAAQHAEAERQELRDEHLPREVARVDRGLPRSTRRTPAIDSGIDPTASAATAICSAGANAAVTAGAQRPAQRNRRAGRDRHQHDSDLGGARQVERATDEPGDGRHRHQDGEQRLGHQPGPLRDPAKLAGHDGEPEVEHDREQRRRPPPPSDSHPGMPVLRWASLTGDRVLDLRTAAGQRERDVHGAAVVARAHRQPERANTSSIALLPASTSASNVAMPFARATAARCRSRRPAMPRPW